MLQDKKIKSSATLQQNKKIKNVKNLIHISDIKYHKRLYLKINLGPLAAFTSKFVG